MRRSDIGSGNFQGGISVQIYRVGIPNRIRIENNQIFWHIVKHKGTKVREIQWFGISRTADPCQGLCGLDLGWS